MKIQSLIIYSKPYPRNLTARALSGYCFVPYEQGGILVRAKVVNGDIDKAMLKSRPKVGETVLNAIPL